MSRKVRFALLMPPSTSRKTTWAWVIATVLGAGRLRPGPGTYGSVVAVLLWFAAAHTLHPSTLVLGLGTLAAAALATAVGLPARSIVARESAREDPSFVVIDEVAGQLLALTLTPPDWRYAALALLLFRVFDILKPPPIRSLEQLPAGTGIMLDDRPAGLLALLVGLLITRLVR